MSAEKKEVSFRLEEQEVENTRLKNEIKHLEELKLRCFGSKHPPSNARCFDVVLVKRVSVTI